MYSDIISINKNFQSSINLELDIGKDNKIDEYIPTSDICDVLKKYIKTALGINHDNATSLIGPYGKGKSFLLLVLTYIFGPNKEGKTWDTLVNKISKVDKELVELLQKVKEDNVVLLPVIINSNYDNVTQSFQIAINDALKHYDMTSIVPKSAYDVCLELLDKWENSTVYNEVLKNCLDPKIDTKKLRANLKSYSPDAYNEFKKMYDCVNIGLEFNPLISNDVVKTYSDVSESIKQFGYSGLFIIFDEFSKFLESTSANLTKDLKIVQDMAELATRSSKKKQILFCCVAHKSLSTYKGDKKQSNAMDIFKTVEGRFKEIRFNRSLEENYQLISSALIKSPKGAKQIKSLVSSRAKLYDEIKELGLFDGENLEQTLFVDCYPLNPMTAYCLIHISELVAQNERTLFTFISDTDDDSLNSFLHTANEGLFNVDKIYDYFSQLFQKEEANSIRNIWYRSESILSKTENSDERKCIKTLAIILMINNSERLPASEEVIACSTDLEVSVVAGIVNRLIDEHYLRKNLLNNTLSFALSNTKKIDEELEILKKTKLKNPNYSDILTKLNEKPFLLPRKYNEENKITRFFKVLFQSEEDFKNVGSYNYYFEENYCDGVVIYLLKKSASEKSIKDKIDKINDNRVVVKYPSSSIDKIFYDSIQTYACLEEILKKKDLDEIALSEIGLLIDETKADIATLMDRYFGNNAKFYSVMYQKGCKFNTLLSDSLEYIYPVKLIFNNELINKKVVTTQYQKAINHVIDWILENKDEDEFSYSDTSPEHSVWYAVIIYNSGNNESSTNFRDVLDEIKNSITNSNGKKISVSDIIDKYFNKPYGIRSGVMPVILAKAISELSDNVVLYYQTKEVDLESDTIVKACSNPANYFIKFSKASKDQTDYLKKMLVLFNVPPADNFRKDTSNLSSAIKKVFIGMPQIVRLCNSKNNYLKFDDSFLVLKSEFLTFNVNAYESVFEMPKKAFKTEKYANIYKGFEQIVNNKDHLLSSFKQEIIATIKELFSFPSDSSLKSSLTTFLAVNIKIGQEPILEATDKALYTTIRFGLDYDDETCLDLIAKVITNQAIEDWDSNKEKQLLEGLSTFKTNIENSYQSSVKTNVFDSFNTDTESLSSMGKLLKNNVESAIDEFSGSVSSSEKITILAALLKDLL